jgi:hypothetical protein
MVTFADGERAAILVGMKANEISKPAHATAPVRRWGIRIAGLAALVALVGVPASAAAKTFKLTSRGDHAPGACTAGDCTLREAVIAATALDGDDKILVPSRKPYNLKRSSSLAGPDEAKGDLDPGTMFVIGNGLKIAHKGAGRATIDASAADDRAIEALGSLRLIKVIVRGGEATSGGQAGGGIHGTGTVILRRSRVVDNEAPDVGGGVFMEQGSLVAERSVLRDNRAGEGGGAFVGPTARLQITKSTVRDNYALTGDGGGLSVTTGPFFGTPRITESAIDHNHSVSDGGGLVAAAEFMLIDNSTFADNTAAGRGGGIHAYPDSLARLNGVTIARNRADSGDAGGANSGGGIFADGGSDVIELRNSLLAKNRSTGDAVNECDAPAPVGIESLGGNLLTSTAGGCDFLGDPEDILAANPKIGQLANNGGPTRTIALKAGSPAINQADGPSPPARDQRGHLRNNPDIGAYER